MGIDAISIYFDAGIGVQGRIPTHGKSLKECIIPAL